MSERDDLPLDVEAALRRCAAGDEFALRAIYQSERRRLMAVALRLVRRRELAEEILHDAFLQIWNKADTYDPRLGSARGWIYTVVRHRALNALRSMQSSPEQEDPDYPALLETYTPPAGAEAAEEHAIARCLERLEEQRRQSVLLAFVDGYSHEQVAARLGAPLGTVKSWIRRGLMSLRECLS
ncbi:MAG: sigma-70 family RNA polymerase sigma factor [Casimicrobiaceae bacterium]